MLNVMASLLLVTCSDGGPQGRKNAVPAPPSPRLAAIRPHLRAGVRYADLVQRVGREDLDAGDSVRRPIYFLDGQARGLWLILEFDGDRLRSGCVWDPRKGGRVVEPIVN